MVLAMGSMVFAWLTGYAYGAARLEPDAARRRSARAVNGTVGAVLVALGGQPRARRALSAAIRSAACRRPLLWAP